uniref:Uncharacterized protein n=1 Tax=Zea mays TaxID=4577 RepID=C4J486_MAIZE|nr:unknown [Zea mays]ACR36850.1 unknown [Zea mays]
MWPCAGKVTTRRCGSGSGSGAAPLMRSSSTTMAGIVRESRNNNLTTVPQRVAYLHDKLLRLEAS